MTSAKMSDGRDFIKVIRQRKSLKMYQIDLYNKKEELVASFYINPAAVASLYKDIKAKRVTGRLNNGQAFEIPFDSFDELEDLVNKAAGTGKHSVTQLPFKPMDLGITPAGDQSDSNGSLAQVNHNLKYIWENTREGNAKLTPEELASGK